jgi:Mn-dependent DtxR family transcriptional regulator
LTLEEFRLKEKKMEKKVLDAMKNAGKPVRPGELAEIIGEESKEISKIISGLKKKGKVISPKRCYYSLSDE